MQTQTPVQKGTPEDVDGLPKDLDSERRAPAVIEHKVFVYGTLMPGGRNAAVAERAGTIAATPASAHGFRLYHLEPEGYPAVVHGPGVVHGCVLTLRGPLRELDALEGVELHPPLYRRVSCIPDGWTNACWIYLYARPERLRGDGVAWMPEGRWTPGFPFDS